MLLSYAASFNFCIGVGHNWGLHQGAKDYLDQRAKAQGAKMDGAHIHLMLNHFPIAGILFAIPILVIAWWRKNDVLGLTGMSLVLLSGLITIPTFLAGEPAGEIIEHLPGISEKLIEIHEEAAEKTIWFVGAAALAALISLVVAFKNKSMLLKAIPFVTILSLCAIGFLAWTNNLGGQISHPEIRKDKGVIPPANDDSRD